MTSSRNPMLGLTLAGLVTLGFGACASVPSSSTAPVVFSCLGRVPPSIRADVQPPAPPPDNTVGAWVVFADGTVGKLSEANDSKATLIWIIQNCEQEQMAAAKAIDRRPFWQKWMKPLKPG